MNFIVPKFYPHVKALMDDPLFMEELFEKPVDYNIDYYDDDVLDDFMNDYFAWLYSFWIKYKIIYFECLDGTQHVDRLVNLFQVGTVENVLWMAN